MKKSSRSIAMLALILFVALTISVPMAEAKDMRLDATVDSVTVAQDKNGNEYVRVIIVEKRDLDGIEYSAGTPVMFFQENVADGKALSTGDTFSAIVDKREYRGSPSYTVRTIIK